MQGDFRGILLASILALLLHRLLADGASILAALLGSASPGAHSITSTVRGVKLARVMLMESPPSPGDGALNGVTCFQFERGNEKKNVLETFCAGGVAKRALLAASQRLQKPTEEGAKRQISHLLTSAFINSLLTGKTGKKYFGFCTPAKSLMGCGITSPQSFNSVI